MRKGITIRTCDDIRPNAFKLHFECFMKHLRSFGIFHRYDTSNDPKEKGITSEGLWQTLAEDGKHDLIKVLQHVENNESGYGSVVVPAKGFSESNHVHNMVLDWLRERNVNIVNVGHEVACLEKALYPETKE